MYTLHEAVAHHARTKPHAPALADANGRMSYAELHRHASLAAAGLRAHGMRAGDVVAVQLPNTAAFVVTVLAAGMLGASVQMLHMPYRRAELSSLLRHGKAAAFVGLTRFKDESPLATVAALGLVRLLVQAPAVALAESPAGAPAGNPGGAVSWADLLQAGEASPLPALDPVAPGSRYVLLHTSGTTAEPKGVPVSHSQFIGNAASAIGPLGVSAADVLLPAAPITHLYGLFVLELSLLAGACVSLLPVFTPEALIDCVHRDRVTAIFAGPAHFKPLLAQPPAESPALAGLRLVCLSGTAVPHELALAVESRLPRGKVILLWGMSELQAGSYGRPDDQAELRLKTAGRPSPGTELRIQVNDEDVGPGIEGRLKVRGPSLFSGYLDNPEATAAAFSDGWFDTGDLGYLTPEGALVLTGRTKEIINRGGVKFNPVDVEAIIDRLPGVMRCAVVPMPDPVLGERACAFVQVADPARDASLVTLAQVTTALERAGIARFKWPERLELISDMPLTPTQKVMRGRLTARLASQARGGPHQSPGDAIQ
ncbi:MAG: class I adenylate-forming enzyme family protein [Lautropia sp.]